MEVTIGKKTGVRLAFPVLHVPQPFQGQGEPAYSAAFILDPKENAEDVDAIRAAIKAAATEKWGAKADGVLAQIVKKGNCAWVEGPKVNGKGDVYDGFEGKYHLNARNGGQPGKPPLKPTLVGPDRQPLDASSGKPYGGCYVVAKLDIWAQDNSYGARINCSIRGVQFRKDGPAFSGGTPAAAEEFEDFSEESDAFFA
jgi:hypothetical protein